MFAKIKDFILRNGTYFIIGAISLFLLKPALAEFNTILLVSFLECLAIFFSGLASFAYTRFSFTKILLEGEDSKYSVYERSSMVKLLGFIFLGVHILVGLVVFAVYLGQFAK